MSVDGEKEVELFLIAKPGQLHKCPRCWKFASTEKDHLCGRCDNVLNKK